MRLYNWGYGGEMAAAPPPSNSSRLASTLPSPCHLALSPRRGLPSPPSLTSLACGRRALVGRAAHWPRFLDAGTRTRVFRVALERARIQLSAAVSWTRLPFLTRCSGHTARDRPPALTSVRPPGAGPVASVYLKQRLTACLLSSEAGTAAEVRALRLRGAGDAADAAAIASPAAGAARPVRGEARRESTGTFACPARTLERRGRGPRGGGGRKGGPNVPRTCVRKWK